MGRGGVSSCQKHVLQSQAILHALPHSQHAQKCVFLFDEARDFVHSRRSEHLSIQRDLTREITLRFTYARLGNHGCVHTLAAPSESISFRNAIKSRRVDLPSRSRRAVKQQLDLQEKMKNGAHQRRKGPKLPN